MIESEQDRDKIPDKEKGDILCIAVYANNGKRILPLKMIRHVSHKKKAKRVIYDRIKERNYGKQ